MHYPICGGISNLIEHSQFNMRFNPCHKTTALLNKVKEIR